MALSNSSAHRSISRQRGSHSGNRGAHGDGGNQMFKNCVMEIQRNLKAAGSTPSLMHTLANYYTRTEPMVEGRPFCVSLGYATFLFHMQMARISISDVDLYTQLVMIVLSQITNNEQLTHPFVTMVLRDRVFGLPSPTCQGSPHCVVLLQPQQFRAFRTMAANLLSSEVVPLDIVYQFQEKLSQLTKAESPMVSNRALALLIETVKHVRLDEQANALQLILQSKPLRMNVDFILACYERLKRIALDPTGGPFFVAALCISCSEIFLRFRSPIRRNYVERFLYPSLCRSDMAPLLKIPETRKHLLRQLLRQCNPGLSITNPYYLCICAVMQRSFEDEINGALETVNLISTHMPHAAYFMSALAVDSRMSISMFAKVIIALSRGAGLAMVGEETRDEVASSILDDASSVYNVLYTLREVVRCCSTTASRRSTDMLKALRVAVPSESVEALGKLSLEVFDEESNVVLDPQLLCAEIAMVLHHHHLEEAVESSVDFLRHATRQCPTCGMQNSGALICPISHQVHLTGHLSAGRVLTTLAECAGAKKLQELLIQYLQNPETQLDRSVHALIYYIIFHAGSYRSNVFSAVEPYIRGTLLSIASGDELSLQGRMITSEQRANVLMLHVKLITLLSSSIEVSYYESTLKVFSQIVLRNNHDALCLWYMGNLLIRQSGPNLELLPTDPLENNYCTNYPGCAPSSHACALNAQLVLKMLDMAHHFSAETRKLVGCCVCRLIQDFNMQAPNIVGTLLSSFGFTTPHLTSLAPYALPIGEQSSFWSFFLQQMRTSPPASIALMTTIARSIGRRFRIEKPSVAVRIKAEDTCHLFTAMLYETMKRSPSISRVVVYMASQWMKQGNNTPGKLACLVYVCAQLVYVIHNRFEDSSSVAEEAETENDKRIFRETTQKAARLLEKMRPKVRKLIDVASQRNEEFYYLLIRLEKKLLFTVSVSNGEPIPDDVGEAEMESFFPEYQAEEYESLPPDASRVVAMEDLEHPEDDAFLHFPSPFPASAQVAAAEAAEVATSPTLEPPHLQVAEEGMSTPLQKMSRMEESPQEEPGASMMPIHIDEGTTSHTEAPTSSSLSKQDKAITAPFERNMGTSPINNIPPPQPVADQQKTLQHNATWHEPSLWSEDAEETPNTKMSNQERVLAGPQMPSSMVLEYLRTHQGMDSIREEMAQLEDPSRSGSRFQEKIVLNYVPAVPTPNNYPEPHKDVVEVAEETFLAPVQVVNVTTSHETALLPQQAFHVRAAAPPTIVTGVVDGETPILSVSEEVGDVKRHRVEGGVMAAPVKPSMYGIQFFLQQAAQQRQSTIDQSRTPLRRSHPAIGSAPEGDDVQYPLVGESDLGGTLQSSRGLPTCLVEQRSSPVLRELRQAMGHHNPNTDGAEKHNGPLKKGNRRGKESTTERSSSTAWWAETRTVPMPNYATDPEYSMELF